MRMRMLSAATLLVLLPASQAVADDLKAYFGLLHGHTSFSDGNGTPNDAFKMATAAGLDFVAVTEHNHSQAAGDDGVFLTPALYEQLRDSAQAHTVPGKFVALWGQELSTISKGNHVNVFFADEICNMPAGDFRWLYEEWLPAHPEVPFMQFNHPDVREDQRPNTPPEERNNDYGIDDYDQDFAQLIAASQPYVALIELIVGPAFSEHTDRPHHNGVHERDYLFYLNKGFRLAPSVGQDNHKKTWGRATHARMGVWAEELTRDGLIAAIRARRCYASEDQDMIVRFTVNGAMMGSVIDLGDSETVSLGLSVQDDGEPDVEYRVQLFYDDAVGGDEAKVIEDVRLESGASEATFAHVPSRGGYYFAKVTQEGDHRDDAWTAPVWIGEGPVELASNTDDPQREEIGWDEAVNYVGQTVTVNGRIIRSFDYRDRVLFFNFDPDYENTLTLVVLGSDFATFGGAEALRERLMNKNVRVRGEITLYRGERMQIRLTSPDQILEVSDGH